MKKNANVIAALCFAACALITIVTGIRMLCMGYSFAKILITGFVIYVAGYIVLSVSLLKRNSLLFAVGAGFIAILNTSIISTTFISALYRYIFWTGNAFAIIVAIIECIITFFAFFIMCIHGIRRMKGCKVWLFIASGLFLCLAAVTLCNDIASGIETVWDYTGIIKNVFAAMGIALSAFVTEPEYIPAPDTAASVEKTEPQ